MPLIEIVNGDILATNRDNILNYLISQFKIIYGDNAYVEVGSIDYNMLSALADIFNDMGMVAVSVSQGYNLQTATGTQLDNLSTIFYNTITRNSATYSQVTVQVTGTPGTTIVNGQVRDVTGGIWNLQSPITIGTSGTVNALATYIEPGPYYIQVNQINGYNSILTPVAGWTNVTNYQASTVGTNVENDASFRYRLAIKAQGQSLTTFNSLYTNLTSIDNLPYAAIWENDTAGTLSYSDVSLSNIPSHSLCISVYGNFNEVSDIDIAQAIYNYKASGVGTYAPSGGTGSTSVNIPSQIGTTQTINFVKAVSNAIPVNIVLQKLSSISPDVSDELIDGITDALGDYLQYQDIGSLIYASALYLPISEAINEIVGAGVYNITSVNLGSSSTLTVQNTYYQKPFVGTVSVTSTDAS